MKTSISQRISIVRKLAGILSLMIVLTLLVATITLSLREYNDLQAKLEKKLILTADMIGQNSCVALLFDDRKTAQEILSALAHDPEIVAGQIETVSGQTFATYIKQPWHWQAFWPSGLPKTLQVSRIINHNGDKIVGRITVIADLKHTYNLLLHNALINAGIVWIALSIAGLFVLRLQRGFLKPILHLADTARQVEQGHDYRKGPLYQGNDEISDLADAFNNMLAEIQRKEAYLEAQVQQRTRELEMAKRHAEAANETKSQFLANMSHEIRTPMNAIFGLVELCLNQPLDAKLRNYLQRVETASGALMTIIDDILDFSKMEAGKVHLESIPFSLEEMLHEVYQTMAELCRRKGIQLITGDNESQSLSVIGDPYRLRQVLLNLIGNAIKFTEHGGVTVNYRQLSGNAGQACLQFSIADTGIGMSIEQQNNLFQAFSQGDNSVTRNYGGTGLGLAISRQLIEQMDGSITVTSREMCGSTFTFTVLLGIADPESVFGIQPPMPAAIEPSKLQAMRQARILVVEDNEINRLVVVELLTLLQLQVEIAENGAEALQKLQNQHYDCVLMDVHMPVMDGCQAVRLLRSFEACQQLPVIAMTASPLPNDREKCLEAGMNDFISKPILPKNLYEILMKWIVDRPDI